MMELGDMQTRLLGIGTNSIGFFVHTTNPVKKAILDEGYSEKYGVRELRRVIRQRIQTPMAKLAASGQIKSRDTVIIELKPNGEFQFGIEERVA
jgi:ATP-dependent Clp protease ATP-binding subunit ClpA